jgi:MFS family permease
MDSSDDSNKSFFKHVFNFDDDSKSDVLNIIQYALVAIIPIVILNKTIGKYVPEADDKKSSLEITAELLIQIIVMFIGLLIIHRIITFIPTYSKAKYPEFHIIYIILAILMITLSLQTKLGEKVTILVDRVFELWDGKKDIKKGKKLGRSPLGLIEKTKLLLTKIGLFIYGQIGVYTNDYVSDCMNLSLMVFIVTQLGYIYMFKLLFVIGILIAQCCDQRPELIKNLQK